MRSAHRIEYEFAKLAFGRPRDVFAAVRFAPQLADHISIDSGMLSNIKLGGMKTENRDLVEPLIELQFCHLGVAAGNERVAYFAHIVGEFGGREITSSQRRRGKLHRSRLFKPPTNHA
jgi:hypothetical protein